MQLYQHITSGELFSLREVDHMIEGAIKNRVEGSEKLTRDEMLSIYFNGPFDGAIEPKMQSRIAAVTTITN